MSPRMTNILKSYGVILHEYFISRNKNLKCEYKEVN